MKDIQRIYTAHTLNSIALSIISLYIPIYFLKLEYSLQSVIFYFVTSHITGLMFGLLIIVPLMNKHGLLKAIKIYYPLQILFLLLITQIKHYSIPLEIIAFLNGATTYSYWMPLNILFIRHSESKEMSKNLGKFFAFPKLFGFLGPLIGAILIPIFGFWPAFAASGLGIIISFYPLINIKNTKMKTSLNLRKAIIRVKRNKTLFLFEGLDNILEESEWFWGIYVYLLIGSLAAPGIVGSLEALGGALFTLIIGKFASGKAKKMIPIASLIILLISFLRFFIASPFHAYAISVAASFVTTMFLVSYFSTIYKTIKNDSEEEFIILREIPTVIGRLVVFGMIYLTLSNLRLFFVLPIICVILILILYHFKNKSLAK